MAVMRFVHAELMENGPKKIKSGIDYYGGRNDMKEEKRAVSLLGRKIFVSLLICWS